MKFTDSSVSAINPKSAGNNFRARIAVTTSVVALCATWATANQETACVTFLPRDIKRREPETVNRKPKCSLLSVHSFWHHVYSSVIGMRINRGAKYKERSTKNKALRRSVYGYRFTVHASF